MQLYNTPDKKIMSVQPQKDNATTVYTCGPTVYDYPHIGNWFTFIRYDVLVRTLKLAGYNPKWVMNITDVGHLTSDADEGEDKLEKGAKREGKTAWDIAAFYSDYFMHGLERLNIQKPNVVPRATNHIAEQIDLIQKLEANGLTYTIDDGVYYDTAKFPTYATFAGLDLDDQKSGARVEFNPQKRNSSDFALWKFSPAHEIRDMEWESPWGKGFPGWHIECSAMAMKYLGETIDIHAGGIDHIPVHHTNEIAQSEGATGKQYVKYWMHANHISVEGQKISKSLGNSITLEDIEAKGISLEAFRLYVLESHYRTQSKFTWDGLIAAQNRLKGYQSMADMRFQIKPTPDGQPMTNFGSFSSTILENLKRDLNTPEALAALSQSASTTQDVVYETNEAEFLDFLKFIDNALGINLLKSSDITNAQKSTITDRETARANKDWQKSDELRDELLSQGISVRDTNYGTIWNRL